MIGGVGGNNSLSRAMNRLNMQKRAEATFAKIDTDNSDTVSKDEFQMVTAEFTEKTGFAVDTDAMFTAADTNGSGLLTKAELANALAQGSPPPPIVGGGDDEETNSLDVNGDGVVNLLDFIGQASGQAEAERENAADRLFKKLDTDNDGKISKSEFRVFANSIARMSGMSIDTEASFASADTDGDGMLSKSEMAVFRTPTPDASGSKSELSVTEQKAKEVISSLDMNGDGVLEAYELKTALLNVKYNAYSVLLGNSGSDSTSLVNLLG